MNWTKEEMTLLHDAPTQAGCDYIQLADAEIRAIASKAVELRIAALEQHVSELEGLQAAREAILSASDALVKAAQALGEPPKPVPPCAHRWIREWPEGAMYCSQCGAQRYPCSATCTHDDAANPGHPERVKEISGAVLAAITKCPQCDGEVEEGYGHASGAVQPAPYLYCVKSCGWRHTVKGEVVWNPTREQEAWFDSGAEAMRAACLEALQPFMAKHGFSPSEQEEAKAAIEGATP